jgi:hypothetical protein
MAEDLEPDATNNEEEPALDVEPGGDQAVPIGVPVSADEFKRLKKRAAEPTCGDEGASADEEAALDRHEEDRDA